MINEDVRVQISANKIDWIDKLSPMTYLTLYEGPTVTKVLPAYGNANEKKTKYISVFGKNFKCLNKGCNELKCRFQFVSNDKDSFYVKAQLINSKLLRCKIPMLNRPEVVKIRVTINDRDYTSDQVSFTYFDPFVVSFVPKIISPKGI